MAFLASCWLIIELVIIPDGFVKWIYLSFYIHPIFLFVCQIFLWLKLLNGWILFVFFYPLRIICFLGLFVFRFFRDCVLICIFRFTRLQSTTNVEVVEEAADEKSEAITQTCNQNQVGVSYICSNIAPIQAYCKVKLFEVPEIELVHDIVFEEYPVLHEEESMEEPSSCPGKGSGMTEHVSSISYSEFSANEDDHLSEYSSSSVCSSNSPARSSDLDEYPQSTFISSSPVPEREVTQRDEYPQSTFISSSPVPEREVTQRDEYPQSTFISSSPVLEREVTQRDEYQESDPFYKKYSEMMSWFDVLNYDRMCGITAVQNKQVGTPSPIESNVEPADFLLPHISWSTVTKNLLLKSLQSDFEMVYVAQSCLSWDALHYQYTKVQALGHSSSQNGVFYGNVFVEFQKFQVLLERFLEDERCEGKRIWNYVRKRFALQSLLQVPQVSGFLEEEREDTHREAVNVKEVLKAIERCIEAFGVFVTVDNNKKPWWKLKSSLWTYPPVEDPRDLELLRYLTRRLQKKELGLKDLQGKQRCWLKRVVNPLEESLRKEMLFTMVDMKLVSRVLQMSTVSSSQLKWCKEKLDNIEFREGKVSRACTSPLLFPPS